jgi:hypothetical protein
MYVYATIFLSNPSASHRVPYDFIAMVHRLEDQHPARDTCEEYVVVSPQRRGWNPMTSQAESRKTRKKRREMLA